MQRNGNKRKKRKGRPISEHRGEFKRSRRGGNGDNQGDIAVDRSQVPQTVGPSSAMFESGSLNSIGGGQFDNHHGDRTNLTVHIHKSGITQTPGNQFQSMLDSDEIGQRISNIQTNLADFTPPEMGLTSQRTIPAQEQQRSNELYASCLMQKGRGYPLWIPQANIRSPKPYRAKGVSIGDVGLITPYGGFDFLFNICLPRDHPINLNQLPMNFAPIHPPLHSSEVREFPEFSSGSYLASSSIALSQSELQSLEMVFESSASEGAILTMPDGAYQEELRNVAKFRDYVTTHAEDWYRYANLTLGCEAENGDLHLVVGCDKSTSWGMATFMNASKKAKFRFKFQPPGTENRHSSGTTSIWEHSGTADVRSGPDIREIHELGATVDNPLRNQCLFMRTLCISLSSTAWEKTTQKLAKGLTNDLEKNNINGNDNFSSNVDQQGERFTAPGNQHSISNTPEGQSRGHNVKLTDLFPSSSTPHPSKLINDFLLKQLPTAVVAVTHDRDWQFIKAGEIGFPSTSALFNGILLLNDICESNGAAYLQLKAPYAWDKMDEEEKLANLKQGFKSKKNKMTVNQYLFGNSEIYKQNLFAFCETLKSTPRPYQDHKKISEQIPSSLVNRSEHRILPLNDLLSLLCDPNPPGADTFGESVISSHHRLFSNPTDDRTSMLVQYNRMKAAYGFSQRYYRLNRNEDLEEAIALLEEILAVAPTDHYLCLDALLALAPLLHQRYLIKGLPQNLLSLVQNLEMQATLDFKTLLHQFEQEVAECIARHSLNASMPQTSSLLVSLPYSRAQARSTKRVSGRQLNGLSRFFQNLAPSIRRNRKKHLRSFSHE